MALPHGMKSVPERRYRIRHFISAIKLADYLGEYRDAPRFLEYCKACDRYGACWSCPPFEFDTGEYLAPYAMAYLIGTKIVLHEKTIEENRGEDECRKTAYGILERVRPGLDRRLLALEKRHPVSKAFFAGMCPICPAGTCTRIKGEPCVAPKKIRPSLESFGFDIGKTAAELLNIELKWSRDGILPEYFTLVSGFFSQKAIPGFSLADALQSRSNPVSR